MTLHLSTPASLLEAALDGCHEVHNGSFAGPLHSIVLYTPGTWPWAHNVHSCIVLHVSGHVELVPKRGRQPAGRSRSTPGRVADRARCALPVRGKHLRMLLRDILRSLDREWGTSQVFSSAIGYSSIQSTYHPYQMHYEANHNDGASSWTVWNVPALCCETLGLGRPSSSGALVALVRRLELGARALRWAACSPAAGAASKQGAAIGRAVTFTDLSSARRHNRVVLHSVPVRRDTSQLSFCRFARPGRQAVTRRGLWGGAVCLRRATHFVWPANTNIDQQVEQFFPPSERWMH